MPAGPGLQRRDTANSACACLLLACEGLYVKTGQLDGEFLRKFELAQRLKLPPAEAVATASAFVKAHARAGGALRLPD